MGRRYTVPFKIIETRLSSLSDLVACVTQPVIANTNKQSPIQIKIVSLDICFGRPIRCGLISAVKSVVSSVQEGNTVTRVIYRLTGSHRQHKQTNPISNKNSIPWYLFLVTIRPTGLWTLCYKVNTIQQTTNPAHRTGDETYVNRQAQLFESTEQWFWNVLDWQTNDFDIVNHT